MTREERREAMPICAAWVDEMKEAFEPKNIEAIRAKENGHEWEWKREKQTEG